MSRVLVIEDNVNLALALRHSLESDGHDVSLAHEGREALEYALQRPVDLIILDLMLPGIDGFAILRTLREAGDTTPVLILSARGEDVDRIQGFRLGADDYVVKPIGLVELLLRVRAILRRTRRSAADVSRKELGELTIDLGARTVERAGTAVDLTPLEFDLLACLLRRRGQAVARDTILAEVWGFPEPGRIRTRTIDTHVATLRAKIELDPANPAHVLTVRKIGYRLAD
jgi:DNA-binding response OmpR family regulator